MAHKIEWDNTEKTVLLQQYLEDATIDDLYAMAKETEALLKTVSHTVHLIIDERASEIIFKSEDIKYLEKHVAANQGYVVNIPAEGTETYKKMLQTLAKPFAPRAFNDPHYARDIEEARETLKNIAQVKYD